MHACAGLIYMAGLTAGATAATLKNWTELQAATSQCLAETLEARAEVATTSQSKNEFIAQMSHELRTPLNSIIGFSEMMTGEVFGPLDPHYADYAASINEAGRHMQAIVEDVLDMARIEAGKLDLHEEDANPALLAEAALRMMRPKAAEGRLTLVSDIAETLPRLKADPRRVQQVLINLLANAVKFTPPGGTVTLRVGMDAEGNLEFAVGDTGVGMAESDFAKALTPFGQVENSMTKCHPGTGLGLPLCKSLVELHGGRLDLASQVGEGTVVTAIFPQSRILPGIAPRGSGIGAPVRLFPAMGSVGMIKSPPQAANAQPNHGYYQGYAGQHNEFRVNW